jgi:transcriptional regulator with XRE-family HTH domain
MGRVIRVLRRRRGLSIEALAFAAGLHPTYLSGIEREGRNPSLMKLWALADALEVSLGQMAGMAERQARVRDGIERVIAEEQEREGHREGFSHDVVKGRIGRSPSQ